MSKKIVSVLLIMILLFSLLSTVSFATTMNSIDRVPQVALDHIFAMDNAPILRIEEANAGEFGTEVFRLSLINAEWSKNATDDYHIDANPNVTVLTNNLAEVAIIGTPAIDVFTFEMLTKITGNGNVQVVVDSRDSAVTGGAYTFAVSAEGKTINTIDKVIIFARTGSLGNIQIDETRIGAIERVAQSIRIKLPPKFTWVIEPDAVVKFTGGITAVGVVGIIGDGERTLTITFTPDTGSTARGSIFLEGFKIRADRDASYGNVVANFDGDFITNSEMVIAKYAFYSIEAAVKSTNELIAGRYNQRTDIIAIKENIPNSMIIGREITIVLPEWVKVNQVRDLKGFNLGGAGYTAINDLIYGTGKNEFFFEIPATINDTQNSRYEFVLDLSIQANMSGDIVAEIFGAGMEKQKVIIAKAVAPITTIVTASDLKIGVQDQIIPDIIITETKKGMVDDGSAQLNLIEVGTIANYYGTLGATFGTGNLLTITLPVNYLFSSTPIVTVTNGDLEIGKVTHADNIITIPIKSSSTKPSTIAITNIKVTLDRTVPEGMFYANIGGSAIVKNNKAAVTLAYPVFFDTGNVVRYLFANVITPAPGDIRVTTTFIIGSTNYTVVQGGIIVNKTMDVSPYIKEGRTYLPVRFVAEALGVSDNNILWDPINATVTIFKGDRITQMTIGSKSLMINGVVITIDASPEIISGRTMLPIRWVAQALGVNIDWNAETQSVKIQQ